MKSSTCRNCDRGIVLEGGTWVDPEATGDDAVWRETCDASDTFQAHHDPQDRRPRTGLEHKAEAERMLKAAYDLDTLGTPMEVYLLAAAQVHATLALAEAVRTRPVTP